MSTLLPILCLRALTWTLQAFPHRSTVFPAGQSFAIASCLNSSSVLQGGHN